MASAHKQSDRIVCRTPAMTICAICGGTLRQSLVTITEPDRFERHLGIPSEGYRRDWIACDRCGSASNVFGCNESDLATLEAAYYEVDMVGADLGARFRKLTALPPGQSDNIERVTRILNWLSIWRDDPFDVLDIGAGTGVFLSRLKDDGGERIGRMIAVEPDPIAASHLTNLARFEVIAEPFPVSQELGTFGLLTLNKVLEHVSDPLAFLRRVGPHVGVDRGVLYVEVPDVLTASHRPPIDNILGALHRHLYTPEGLAIALRVAGFIPIRLERIAEPSDKLTVIAFAISQGSASSWAAAWRPA